MVVITNHAAQRFLKRVIGTDDYDAGNIKFATRILRDALGCKNTSIDCHIPIDGFKGVTMRIINNTVVTVNNKGKRNE